MASPFRDMKLLRLRTPLLAILFLATFLFLTGCQYVNFGDNRREEPEPEGTFIGNSFDENGNPCQSWEEGDVSKTYCDYTSGK